MQPTTHILIVEDNRALCRVIQVVVEQAGYNVKCAHDGQAAWSLVEEQKFDLIVTDQQMPVMNGVDLCQKIRGLEGHYSTIPIFLLTAKGLELDLPKLKEELAITNVFAKPFSPTALVSALDECLTATS